MTRKKSKSSRSLFRDPSGQIDMFEKSYEEEIEGTRRAPVTCLGLTFENDEARREYFLGLLREGLEELEKWLGRVKFKTVNSAVDHMSSVKHWPMSTGERLRVLGSLMGDASRREPEKDLLQLWKDQVGFPSGEIDDILHLSDPPYYSACPNPFLEEFVKQHATMYDHETDEYAREPFAVDVSVGKTDPLYRAHAYHTKVPHLAIAPSILHYTDPGDLILDGFCGSGMTGVAAQWCGTAPSDYRRAVEQSWDERGRVKPEWGSRRVILGDLAPAATFIAANYNIPFNLEKFAEGAGQLLKEIELEIGWMYETAHNDGRTIGRINYTVWSEVFSCPECSGEVVHFREALEEETHRVKKEFPCPSCGARLTKTNLEKLQVSQHDEGTGKTVKESKRVPVLINYSVGKNRYEKKPDDRDIAILRRIDELELPAEIPTDRMMHAPAEVDSWGDKWRAGTASFTHVHHLFSPRAAQALAAMWRLAVIHPNERERNMLLFFVEQAIWTMSALNRYRPTGYSQVNQYLTGVYYVPSQHSEPSPWYVLEGKLGRLEKAFDPAPSMSGQAVVTTGDCATMEIPDKSVDYVFTDPPFGDNLAYGELNFVNEAFLHIFTNLVTEAIVSKTQKKHLVEYRHLMQRCFEEYCRILKPGRWMTVTFHNSKNAVWNAIQESILAAGFVVADVRTLDKKQGSFNQVVAGGSVKQDLIISAYKPTYGLDERFKLKAGMEEGVWEFLQIHLRQLPVFVSKDGRAEAIVERQSFLLFDRMVAFHVQRGVTVPLSAAEFYAGLDQRFPERDGMYFLPEQAAEYDKKRLTVKEVLQLQLFVIDEETSILWLKQQLTKKPQTFQELHPQFLKEIGGWQKHEKPLELSDLLEENFLRYDDKGEVPSQIHSYLSSNYKGLRNLPKDDDTLVAKAKDRWYVPDPNKQADLEKLRERTLLREFEEYREVKQKRLKVFRLEAMRAGFKKAWQERDYDTIIVVAEKIPEKVLQEDPKLLMWYDQAITRRSSL